jgi:hypothetical protein
VSRDGQTTVVVVASVVGTGGAGTSSTALITWTKPFVAALSGEVIEAAVPDGPVIVWATPSIVRGSPSSVTWFVVAKIAAVSSEPPMMWDSTKSCAVGWSAMIDETSPIAPLEGASTVMLPDSRSPCMPAALTICSKESRLGSAWISAQAVCVGTVVVVVEVEVVVDVEVVVEVVVDVVVGSSVVVVGSSVVVVGSSVVVVVDDVVVDDVVVGSSVVVVVDVVVGSSVVVVTTAGTVVVDDEVVEVDVGVEVVVVAGVVVVVGGLVAGGAVVVADDGNVCWFGNVIDGGTDTGFVVDVDPGAVWVGSVLDVSKLFGDGTLSSLLPPSPSPPVKTMSEMTPRIRTAAPAAMATIAPGCDHQGPGGGSYSGSYSHSPPGGTPPAPPPAPSICGW